MSNLLLVENEPAKCKDKSAPKCVSLRRSNLSASQTKTHILGTIGSFPCEIESLKQNTTKAKDKTVSRTRTPEACL